jgi:voltage-gated potassium channel Kch
MHVLAGVLGAVAIAVVAIDVFETIVLPRRVTRRLRLTGVMYRVTWGPWRRAARLFPSGTRRKDFLSVYGPFSILLLLALWTVGLIAGFAALQWANGSALDVPGVRSGFGTDLYFSATTFLTLGLGDVVPRSGPARLLTAIEAAGGFGVLALVIGYLPTLYQAFSRREIAVSLLDARAGSPPSAGELAAPVCRRRPVG